MTSYITKSDQVIFRCVFKGILVCLIFQNWSNMTFLWSIMTLSGIIHRKLLYVSDEVWRKLIISLRILGIEANFELILKRQKILNYI